MKRVYKEPLTAVEQLAPQSIICTSITVGGDASHRRGEAPPLV